MSTTKESASTDPSILWKLFFMMVLEIAIWGAWQVKVFALMGDNGLKFTSWQQALAGSMFGIASVVGIFFSNQFVDRNFSAEKFLAFSHLVGGLALFATSQCTEFWPFFACFLLYGLVYVPTLSVTNSLAFSHLKNPAGEFGFVRMGGTIGWIIISWPFIFLLGAKATVAQMQWIFIVAAIVSFILAAFSLMLPHTPPRKAESAGESLAWVKAFRELRHPFVFVLFLVTLIDSIIHNGYFVLVDGFLSGAVGLSENYTMAITTIGQVAEILTMLVLGRVLVRLGWKWTMLVGILGHALRFATFSFFGNENWQSLIVFIQVLHGICYAFFFATLYIFVDEVFPKDIRTSAQGLFNLLILGVGLVLANFGFIYLRDYFTSTVDGKPVVDYFRVFLVPTALAILGMLMLMFGFRPPSSRPGQVVEATSAPH
jgi:MFS family permease